MADEVEKPRIEEVVEAMNRGGCGGGEAEGLEVRKLKI